MTDVKQKTITTFDGSKLNMKIYASKRLAHNTLIITHGYGEHSGYYEDFAEYFSTQGYNVITYDLRSHGLSEGRRGDVPDFEFFLKDLQIVIDEAKRMNENNKIALFGHSLGGSIVLNFLFKNPGPEITKAVISSPWLKLAFDPPVFKKILAKIGKVLFPSLVIKGELNLKHLSRDQKFIDRFRNDVLTYDKISARYYDSIIKAGLFVLNNARKLRIPVLVSHGDDDKITSYSASKGFCEISGAMFKSWDGGYRHVVFSESDKNDIFKYYHKYLATL
jgi:alpha-beta hydrolase superfamily lysophospholipase